MKEIVNAWTCEIDFNRNPLRALQMVIPIIIDIVRGSLVVCGQCPQMYVST